MLTTKFKKDDLVIFYVKTRAKKPEWRKGIIVGNNFPMMNEHNEFLPEYYVAELDIDEDNVVGNNSARYFAVSADDNNIEYWTPYMEDFWLKTVEHTDIDLMRELNEKKEYAPWHANSVTNNIFEVIDDEPFDIYEPETNNWVYDKLCEISIELRQLHDKMDLIYEKVRKLESTPTYIPYNPYPKPVEPYYKPPKYDPELWKIYCETKTTNRTDNLNANIKPEEEYMYKEMFSGCDPNKWHSVPNDCISTTSTDTFDYAKYNHMSTCTDKNVNAKYEQFT